ncbi:unnamed protein product [Cylindrotheca closterium]|uniref:DUF6824 domain-containing protein n=1 Tax=Cylindrotheca closterium TaxID=2856 RepID=A0AAD2FS80_9STRA|nr:unnamed protein product [Cylindrotheca closterium]
MTKESKPLASQSPSTVESKYPPAETMAAGILSQSGPILPSNDARDNGTPTHATSNRKDSLRSSNNAAPTPTKVTTSNLENLTSSSDTNGVENHTTDTSKPTAITVSGSPRDIICGRGLHIMNHHGNHNLHLIVDRYRQTYLTSTRRDKAAITQHIVKQLKSTGARFLRRFNDDSDDKWLEVDDKTAYKKVSHALRLRKSNHGQNFLESLPGQQAGSQQSVPLHSTSRRETISTSQNIAGIPIGTKGTMSHPSSRLPSSPSLATQLPFSSPTYQLQVATQSAIPPVVGTHIQPRMLHPSATMNGYDNVAMDPQLFANAFATTLVIMTQLQQQQRLLSYGCSIDDQRSRRNSDDEGT